MSMQPPSGGGSAPMNPYVASTISTAPNNAGDIILPNGTQRGLIGQVTVVGILMIVQGALEVFMGIVVAGYAAFFPTFMDAMQEQAVKTGETMQPMPPEFANWMMAGGALLGGLVLIIGIVTIIAGYKITQFRGRILAIVSLCLGLTSVFTCYCFPTALALTIYGLIVLLNTPVKLAFEYAAAGYSNKAIQRAFAMLP